MEQPNFIKKFFTTYLRVIFLVFILLVVGLTAWYILSNRAPMLGSYTVSRGNVVASVDIPGTVSSSNSVDLSFQESGQIATVYVKEGQSVESGEALVKLDDSTEQTQLSQQKAILAAAEANLASLLAGATPQDITVSEAAVDKANQDLTNFYSSIDNVSVDGYSKATDAVQTQLGAMFTNAQLNFPNMSDSQSFISANTDYSAATLALSNWQQELSTITSSSNNSDLDSLLQNGLTYLNTVDDLLQNMSTILNNNSTNLNSTTLATYRENVSTGIAEVNLASKNLTTLSQSIASQKVVVAQAQANLALTQAGSTENDIDAQKAAVLGAQAEIDNAQLMINHTIITAPFSGIVRNVIAEPGMVVSPNVPVISIINNKIMKIDAYASEIDVSNIQENATATVTLDSYGDGTEFGAQVTAVDTAETVVNGSPAYHVTLYFTQPDDRIRAGMTGNVLIVSAEHDNVVEIPARLILDSGNNNFVIVKNGKTNIERPVVLGITGDDGMVEVISGLNVGEKISDF